MFYPALENVILSVLSKPVLRRVLPRISMAGFDSGHVFHRYGEPLDRAVFPVRGAVSLMHADGAGKLIEVALAGNRGMLGVPLALGTAIAPSTAIAQTSGAAYVMNGATLRECFQRSPAFKAAVDRYVHFLIVTLGQAGVCKQEHVIEKRWATRLLNMQDLLRSNSFELTQAALSETLGVRRASISQAAVRLQRRGMVRYERGTLTVVNRRALEKLACPCYQMMRAEYRRLFPAGGHAR